MGRIKAKKKSAIGLDIKVEANITDDLWIMHASDVHYDSNICDVELLTGHLREAEALEAPVLFAGDVFDAMQGRYDPRRSPEDLKAKFGVSSYFDALVEYHCEFFSQFDLPLVVFGRGNHETSVLKNAGTDLTERLVAMLRYKGINAVSMGYWGYVRVHFLYKEGSRNASTMIYFYHGTSSHARVTRGVIQTNRQGVYIRDAQLVHNGHLHEAYAIPIKVEKVSQRSMKTRSEVVWYIRTPGYVLSSSDTMAPVGYSSEKHRAPKPRGCSFVRYGFKHGKVGREVVQKIQ